MAVPAKLFRFAAPSGVAAVVGTACAGLAEAIHSADGLGEALAAVGFLAILGVPGLWVLGLVFRGLWRSWGVSKATQNPALLAQLIAWAAYLVIASGALVAGVFHTLRLLFIATSARNVIAVAATLAIVTIVLVLVGLSRSVVVTFARIITWADRRWRERRGQPLWTARRVGCLAVLVGAVFVLALWLLLIRPNIGHFDLSFAWYLIAGAALFSIVQVWLTSASKRVVAIASAAAGSVLIAVLGVAAWTLAERPYSILSLWGDAPLAGGAIDQVFGIEELRDSIDLGEFRPGEIPGREHPDVVLITVDTVRADQTPIYQGKAEMAELRKFASDGTVFEWAFASGNVTRRSMPSLATGLSPRRVRGRVAGWALRLDPRHVLLAERLKAAGYDTAGFFCCLSHFGREHHLGLIRGVDRVEIEYDGDKLVQMADHWLAERGERGHRKPVFLWLHLIEPHNWDKDYPRKKHGADVRKRYGMSLEAVDRALAPLLHRLSEPDARKSTITVFTSDHGEGLGEHGARNHAETLYNSEIHVPLVVVGGGAKARRIQEAVGLADVAPSILELAGFEPPTMPAMDGRSFAALVRGERESRIEDGHAYSTMMQDRSVKEDKWALVSGRYKLIVDGPTEAPKLFELRGDKRETKDLAKDQPEVVERMMDELAQRRAVDRTSPF